MTKEDDGRMRRKMREGEREMHERRRHGRRMNGTKEEMHIYLVA